MAGCHRLRERADVLQGSPRTEREAGENSLVGSNSSPQAMQLAPDITTISSPMSEIGSTSMVLLEGRILSGQATVHRRVALTAKLTVRGSTKQAKSA
jgi:DNA-binding LacI/PurR family transcriptional regulator